MRAFSNTIGSTTAPVREAAPTGIPADVPVERLVVAETVRRAAADALALKRSERVEELRHVRPTDAALVDVDAAADAPSAELVGLLAHLRSTVIGYVRERHAAGAPIERVIPEMKDLVREAASQERWVDPAGALTAQVVRWTIEAYYDQPELAHVPRFY